jgi:hypothetical protein
LKRNTSKYEAKKWSSYEQREAEDANYELKFKAEYTKAEESFWQQQKQYERNLKEDNRRAYRAYIQVIKDAQH